MVKLFFLSVAAVAAQPERPAPDLSRPAMISSGSISDRDYPRAALARGEQGDVRFRVLVTERGRVRECVIEQSSGFAALDEQSCALWTQRFRFRAARDAQGRAVTQTLSQMFKWRINAPCGSTGPRDICINRDR